MRKLILLAVYLSPKKKKLACCVVKVQQQKNPKLNFLAVGKNVFVLFNYYSIIDIMSLLYR